MSSYIYRVTVSHPRLGDMTYVGIHKWSGEGIDPDYKGSCKLQYWRLWVSKYPVKVEVLKDNACLSDEPSFIKNELLTKGSYLKSFPNHEHLHKFPSGNCVNGHWQDASQMHTKDARRRSEEAQKKWYFRVDEAALHDS